MKRNDSAGGEQANDDPLLAQTQPCISIPHAITDIALPTFPFLFSRLPIYILAPGALW